MKIFFIGFAVNSKTAHCTNGVSTAGNNMQLGIINGLKNIVKDDLKVFSIRPIATYPNESIKYVKKEFVSISDCCNSLNISFINMPLIKKKSIYKSLLKTIRNEIEKSEDKDIILVVFNAVPFVSMPINKLAKKYNLKSVCILADPPVDNIRRSFIGKILREIRDEKSIRSIQSFDKLVVLNKNASDTFAQGIPSIVVDCGIEIDEYRDEFIKKINIENQEKKIIFTGTIQEHSGIENLVKAMRFVTDEKAVLYIYGKGPMEEKIKEISKDMKNVCMRGFLPYDEIKKIQKEGYLLVNPSSVDHPINKVAFPSKLMEYMLSGTPVVSNKLECIGEEYNDNIYFFEKDTPECMGEKISSLLEMDYEEYMKIAKMAKKFIIENKDWNKQSKKIYEFIK